MIAAANAVAVNARSRMIELVPPRGPGETQLETDRRVIRVKIAKLKERVENVGHAD